jgi:hypothetical protein
MSRAWPDMLRRYPDAPHESKRPYCENEGEAIPDGNPTRGRRCAPRLLRCDRSKIGQVPADGRAKPVRSRRNHALGLPELDALPRRAGVNCTSFASCRSDLALISVATALLSSPIWYGLRRIGNSASTPCAASL